jgi:hypothetical protein
MAAQLSGRPLAGIYLALSHHQALVYFHGVSGISKQFSIQRTLMDDELLTEYIAILHQYGDLLRRLYVHLEPSIRLQRLVHGALDFMPTAPTIKQQIQQWPDALFRYPPVAWVHPRKGTLMVDGQPWSFAFHGAGLSFFQAATQCDVSGEFSSNGILAITEHTAWCYLSTNPTNTANFAALGSLHKLFFKEAEARQVLIPISPLLAGDDQTYQVVDLKTTDERLYDKPAG